MNKEELQIKYGIFYAYWEQEWMVKDFIRHTKKVADLGFDILEVTAGPLASYTQAQIKELKAIANDVGIELSAGYGPLKQHDIGAKNLADRTKAIDWYKGLFEVMEQLDITFIGGAIYSYWPIDYSKGVDKDADLATSIEGMKVLAPIAKSHNIVIGAEILNRFENHILNTAQEGVEYVKAVGEDNVKVMLDTFHMNIEEDSFTDAILATGDYLGHFHVGECNRKVPGKGRIPWDEVGKALKAINYSGRVVFEPFVKRGGQVETDIKVFRDLSNNADEVQLDKDAAESLIFLKNKFEI